MKFEEQRSLSSGQLSGEASDEIMQRSDLSDGENLVVTDEEEGVKSRQIHKSHIDYKLKLNDYVFDERQNL